MVGVETIWELHTLTAINCMQVLWKQTMFKAVRFPNGSGNCSSKVMS